MTPEILRAPARKQSAVQVIQTSGSSFVAPNSFYNPPPNRIRGVASSSAAWWTAGQPVLPIAPAGTSPRGWQFLSEQNKIFTPRATEFLTFDDLRRLASYPLAQIMISLHAEQIAARKFAIRLRQIPGQKQKDREAAEQKDDRIRLLTDFLMNPSPDTTWREFVYMWATEILTTDAPSLFIRRNMRRDIGELRLIDGAMIARYVDDNGWTPTSESPAYAQLWWGTPAWDLTRDQLFYRPMRPRVYKLYGNSPTEKMARLLELGWARLELKLQWAENGTIPDGLMVVPPDAPLELVERQQAWMNSVMAGNAQRRVQLRLIQGFMKDGKDQILFPKEKMLMDPYDEYEIRSLAVGYGVPKQRFMEQMNRASAESAQEAAEQEGYWPTQQYIMDSMNLLIQSPLYFGLKDYEFTYADEREKDVLKQEQADDIYIKNGTKSWNETRDPLGLDPYQKEGSDDLANSPLAFGNPIYNAYDSADQVAASKASAAPKEQPSGNEPTATEGTSTTRGQVLPGNKPPKKASRLSGRLILDADRIEEMNQSEVRKFLANVEQNHQFFKASAGASINPNHFSLQGEKARRGAVDAISKCLGKVAKKFADKVRKEAKKVDMRAGGLRKSDEEDIKKLLGDDYWNTLWIDLPDDLTPELKEAVLSGMAKGIMEVNVSVSNTKMIDAFQTSAYNYAKDRAAEMVGMKYDDAGELVANPKAQYVISDSTRDDLRELITQAFSENTKLDDLVDQIQNAGMFSVVRAQMIANTEVNRAQAGGTYEVWKQTGVVKTVRWQHSNLPNVCEDCTDNSEEEVAFGKAFPSGDLHPPAHPNCRCVVYAVKTGKAN